MKTKTELCKDWEENDSLKTGKVLCKIYVLVFSCLYCAILILISN